ncbi:MAG: hypothetical protein JO214_10190 [Frankiaceae bacterium]|nr:hypothetical protein [Frankiaceae bacterium]
MAARVAAAARRAIRHALDDFDRDTLTRVVDSLESEAAVLLGNGSAAGQSEASYAFASLTLDAVEAALQQQGTKAPATAKEIASALESVSRMVVAVRDDQSTDAAEEVARLFGRVADSARARSALVGESVEADTPLRAFV